MKTNEINLEVLLGTMGLDKVVKHIESLDITKARMRELTCLAHLLYIENEYMH